MAFNYPCDLDHIDAVLPFKLSDRLYVSIRNNQILNAEGDNGYAYVVAGTTKDNLQLSLDKFTHNDEDPLDSDITEVSVIELLIRWRAFILDGEATLVLGCEDYWCDTALCSPKGALYPHPYTIISYLQDLDGNDITDEHGSLKCAGSQTQLIVSVLYNNEDYLTRFYANKLRLISEPLIYLAERYKVINCEGSICSVPMAIAHSAIARKKEGEEHV